MQFRRYFLCDAYSFVHLVYFVMDYIRPLIASTVAVLAWDSFLSSGIKNYVRALVAVGFNWLVNQLPFEISSVWQIATPLLLVAFFPRLSMVVVVPYAAHLWYEWFKLQSEEYVLGGRLK